MLLSMGEDKLGELMTKITNETQSVIESNPELVGELSRHLNIPESTIINTTRSSPFGLRAAILAVNQGISFYHHELRKVITPLDDYERLKRKEMAEKIENEKLKAELRPSGKSTKTKNIHKDGVSGEKIDQKKSMSIIREMEIVKEQQEEASRFEQLKQNSSQWDMGELIIQPSVDSFLTDDVFARFQPSHYNDGSATNNPYLYQILQKMSKFFWNENQTHYEMLTGTLLNKIIPKMFCSDVGDISNFKQRLRELDLELTAGDLEILNHLNNNRHDPETQKSLHYVRGHFKRVISPPLSTVLSSLNPETYHLSSIQEYRSYLEQLLDSLLFDTVSYSGASSKLIPAQRDQRLKLDLLLMEANRQYMVYHIYQTSPDEKYAQSDLRKLGHLVQCLKKKTSTDFFSEAARYLNPTIFANGIVNTGSSLIKSPETIPTQQLYEGLFSCIPSTIYLLEFAIKHQIFNQETFPFETIDQLILNFSQSKIFFRDLPLSSRFQQYLLQPKFGLSIFYKDLIEFEQIITDLTINQDFDHWSSDLSIELEEELEDNQLKLFIIFPTAFYKLVKFNNGFISRAHKAFSEDLDASEQEMGIFSKNKKIFEREIKERNDSLIEMIKDGEKSNEPSVYIVGIFEENCYHFEISPEWEHIWNQLEQHKNGICLKQFKDKIDQQLGTTGKDKKTGKYDMKKFLTTLTELNKYGAIGLVPKL
eukprot:gene5157-6418_t